jgi:putative molybdopterin biosynthesis protein
MVTQSLLKSADVAELLKVHPKQIYRLLARGLPAHRVGGEWRFLREEVLAWSGMPAEQREAPASALAATVPPLLAANGDLVIEVLASRLIDEDKPLLGIVQLDRGRALERLAARTILLAGFHGDVPPSHVETSRLARIHLVKRDIGLAFPRGSRLRKIGDLRKKRLALRPSTAGVRAHFDRALTKERTTLTALGSRVSLFESHGEAVCAVVRGDADAALTTSAWAERVGLGFLPLASEPYDLLVYAECLGTPECVAVCEVAQSRPFRANLSKIAGYDARDAGEIRYER